ncbi:MAG: transcriptional repressor [Acidimicrobiales bacterium]
MGRVGTPQRRDTRQRRAVLGALTNYEAFRSAQDIHAAVRSGGEAVGLATVYRSLQLLADAGEVDVLRDDSGELLYRRCADRGHHHHVVCRSCGTAVEVKSDAVGRWATTVAEEHGFTEVEHWVEVFGTCAKCARHTS